MGVPIYYLSVVVKNQGVQKMQGGNWWDSLKKPRGYPGVASRAVVAPWGKAVLWGGVVALCLVLSCTEAVQLVPYRYVPTTDAGKATVANEKIQGEVGVECPLFNLTTKRGVWQGHSMRLPLYLENTGNSILEVDVPHARASVLDDPHFSEPFVRRVVAPVKAVDSTTDVVILESGKAADLNIRFIERIGDLVYLDLTLKAGDPPVSYGLQFQYKAEPF